MSRYGAYVPKVGGVFLRGKRITRRKITHLDFIKEDRAATPKGKVSRTFGREGRLNE